APGMIDTRNICSIINGMDTEGKLSLIGSQMYLEPAEETDGSARPVGRADPRQRAPCGHSPAELRRAYEAGDLAVTQALTKGGADPGAALERKKNSLGVYHA